VPRTAACVLALLVLAGCASSPPSTAPAPTAAAAPLSSTSSPAPTAPAAPLVTPFHWAGHTKEGAWVCPDQTGAGQCMAGQQVLPDGGFVTQVAYPGSLASLVLTMAWQADPTQVGGLTIAVFANTTQGLTPVALAHGASPLDLQVDATGLHLVRDGQVMLMVWPQGKTATSPSVFVDATQQAFVVDGQLWTVP